MAPRLIKAGLLLAVVAALASFVDRDSPETNVVRLVLLVIASIVLLTVLTSGEGDE